MNGATIGMNRETSSAVERPEAIAYLDASGCVQCQEVRLCRNTG